MYISVFQWGQGRREIIFRMWKQKPLRVIAGNKTVRNAVNRGVVCSSKKKFFKTFAWSHIHKLSYLRNFDRSWSSRRCFWCRLRAVLVISKSHHQLRSRWRTVSCDRVNVNKPKLRNFDWPLGLSGHLQWSFWHRQCGCVATAATVSHGTTVMIAQT